MCGEHRGRGLEVGVEGGVAEDTEEGAVGMGGWGRGRDSLPIGVKVRVEEPGRGGGIFLKALILGMTEKVTKLVN